MNKLLFFIPALAFAACTTAPGKAKLYIPHATIELGNIKFDSSCDLQYTLVNKGNAVLSVDTITASCGCTIPAATRYTIKPMDSAELVVHFKPADTGTFDKKVIIKSNTDSNFTVVSFRGKAQK